MKNLIAITLLLFSSSSLAESYLCIAEQRAQVMTSLEGSIFESANGESDHKLVIKEEGLFEFGEDELLLPCSFSDNGYIRCMAPAGIWGGYFDKTLQNNFTYIITSRSEEWGLTDIYVGECTKI